MIWCFFSNDWSIPQPQFFRKRMALFFILFIFDKNCFFQVGFITQEKQSDASREEFLKNKKNEIESTWIFIIWIHHRWQIFSSLVHAWLSRSPLLDEKKLLELIFSVKPFVCWFERGTFLDLFGVLVTPAATLPS